MILADVLQVAHPYYQYADPQAPYGLTVRLNKSFHRPGSVLTLKHQLYEYDSYPYVVFVEAIPCLGVTTFRV